MKSENFVQFIKFCIVGVINTAVDWIVFYVLTATFLGSYHSAAKALAFLVAMLNSYFWNTVWTFKKEYQSSVGKKTDSNIKSAIFGKFMLVSLVGWAVNVGIYSLTAKYIGFSIINRDLVPLVLASGAAIIWNFLGNKMWTYKK